MNISITRTPKARGIGFSLILLALSALTAALCPTPGMADSTVAFFDAWKITFKVFCVVPLGILGSLWVFLPNEKVAR